VRARENPLLTLHPVQQALGAIAYRDLLAETLNPEDLAAIRAYLQQQRAYGRDDFRAMIEAKTQRFAGVRPAHRPAKSTGTSGQVNLTPFCSSLARGRRIGRPKQRRNAWTDPSSTCVP
jgi:hypothetical protein